MKNKQLERQILIGFIISDRFLREVVLLYKPGFFPSKGASKLIDWCLDYFKQYGKAPLQHIQDIFNSKVRDQELDADEERFIEDLLSSLSEEFTNQDKFNVDYVLDETETFFKSRSLKLLTEDVSSDIAQGNVKGAEARFNRYKPIARAKSIGINPFTNRDAIKSAFEYNVEPLFTLPGRLGEVMNPQLVRESFISLLGPEKRGKTHWLDYLARRAYLARCNVAYFDTGDMTVGQKIRRIQSSINEGYVVGAPIKTVLYPVLDCGWNQDDSCDDRDRESKVGLEEFKGGKFIDYVKEMIADRYYPCTACRRTDQSKNFKGAAWYELREIERLSWQKAYRASSHWITPAKNARFKLSVHESDSLSIEDIKNQLDMWEHFEGFIPDVIIVDYADIMKNDSNTSELRHQENSKWKGLRAISQIWHCCVITATQANAASYKEDSLAMSHFSEDKRKYGHVTAMYTLNQTPDEKRRQIMRIGELLVREGDYDLHRQVTIMQCLTISKPYVGSF